MKFGTLVNIFAESYTKDDYTDDVYNEGKQSISDFDAQVYVSGEMIQLDIVGVRVDREKKLVIIDI